MKSSNIFEQVIMWCQYNEFETFLIKLKLHRKWRCGCWYLLLWVLVSTSTTYLSTFSPFLSIDILKILLFPKAKAQFANFERSPFHISYIVLVAEIIYIYTCFPRLSWEIFLISTVDLHFGLHHFLTLETMVSL